MFCEYFVKHSLQHKDVSSAPYLITWLIRYVMYPSGKIKQTIKVGIQKWKAR